MESADEVGVEKVRTARWVLVVVSAQVVCAYQILLLLAEQTEIHEAPIHGRAGYAQFFCGLENAFLDILVKVAVFPPLADYLRRHKQAGSEGIRELFHFWFLIPLQFGVESFWRHLGPCQNVEKLVAKVEITAE